MRFRSDGGPQFASRQFNQFLKRWGDSAATSTPHYRQSNGHAEAAVKAMKKLIATTTVKGDLYRNTPRAQILFGHPLPSVVLAHRQSFASKWQKTADEQDASCRQAHARNEERYNRRSRPLPQLHIGTQVRLQNPITKKWDRVGVIIGIGRHRDYHVKLPSGRVYWRNRRFMKPDTAQSGENYLRVDNNVETEDSDTGHTERDDIMSPCRNEPRRSKRQRVPPSKIRL